MLTIPNEDDFDEFMESIIDHNNAEHVKICRALKEQQFGKWIFKKGKRLQGD